MDWTEGILIATAVLTAAMVFILVWHAKEMKHATKVQAFMGLLDRLQDEEVRAARKTILNLKDKGKPIDLNDPKVVEKAGIVCHTYDVAGIMVNNKMIEERLLTDNWGHSIRSCWRFVKPLVDQYRVERKAPKLWNGFESLAGKC